MGQGDWTKFSEKISDLRSGPSVLYPEAYDRKYISFMNLHSALGEKLKKARSYIKTMLGRETMGGQMERARQDH